MHIIEIVKQLRFVLFFSNFSEKFPVILLTENLQMIVDALQRSTSFSTEIHTLMITVT